MELFPNNLEVAFYNYFSPKSCSEESLILWDSVHLTFLDVYFLRKDHFEVIVSHLVLVLNKIDQIINKINSGNKGARL